METTTIDPSAPEFCRAVTVQGAGTLQVPRHINRVDGTRLAGWQVRFGEISRYFSDSKEGDAAAALEAASSYLRAIWHPRQPRRRGPKPRMQATIAA